MGFTSDICNLPFERRCQILRKKGGGVYEVFSRGGLTASNRFDEVALFAKQRD